MARNFQQCWLLDIHGRDLTWQSRQIRPSGLAWPLLPFNQANLCYTLSILCHNLGSEFSKGCLVHNFIPDILFCLACFSWSLGWVTGVRALPWPHHTFVLTGQDSAEKASTALGFACIALYLSCAPCPEPYISFHEFPDQAMGNPDQCCGAGPTNSPKPKKLRWEVQTALRERRLRSHSFSFKWVGRSIQNSFITAREGGKGEGSKCWLVTPTEGGVIDVVRDLSL